MRNKILKKLPQYNYIKASDLPGDVQMITNADIQDQILFDKNDLSYGNKIQNKEACQREFASEISKLDFIDLDMVKNKKEIKYEYVYTPFEIYFNNTEINDDNYKGFKNDEKIQNFEQKNLFILSSWVKNFIPDEYEVSYISKLMKNKKVIILVLMYNNEIYPLNKEEAEILQLIVNKYVYSDKALLLDLNNNLLISGKICSSHWLKSVVPFIKMKDVHIIDNHVVTSDIYYYEQIYEKLLENILYMYNNGYILAIPVYHQDVIDKWELKGSEVEIKGLDIQNQILCYVEWEDTRFAPDKLKILEKQLSGDHWLKVYIGYSDLLKHLLAIQLFVNFKYYKDYILFECDNLQEAVRICNLIELTKNNQYGEIVKQEYLKENILIDFQENSVIYKIVENNGETRFIYSLIAS